MGWFRAYGGNDSPVQGNYRYRRIHILRQVRKTDVFAHSVRIGAYRVAIRSRSGCTAKVVTNRLRASIKLLTIRGIPVEINVSWLIAFALITWTFSTAAFPANFLLWSRGEYWLAGAVTTFLLFASVLAHELGHSFVALSQGLKVHSITLLLFGGVSRIEGGATRARNDIFIALAGPAVSLTIGALLVGWWAAFGPERQFQVTPLHGVLIFTGLMNILVGVFNLLPGYPLDGGRVLRSAVWALTGDTERASRVAFAVGRLVFFLLIAWGGWRIVNGDVFGGVWAVFVGWFLLSSARGERAAQKRLGAVADGAANPAVAEAQAAVDAAQATVDAAEATLASTPETITISESNPDYAGAVAARDTAGAARESAVAVLQSASETLANTPAEVIEGGMDFAVGVVARPMPPTVDVSTTVSAAMATGLPSGHGDDFPVAAVPVARGGELIGFVTAQELRDVPVESRNEVNVGQVVDSGSLRVISAYEPVRAGLQMMDRHRVVQLVVIDGGLVVGVVTRQDILARMIEARG